MGEDTFFTGQPVLNQILSQFIPRQTIDRVVKKHQSDYYCKSFDTYHHLVVMLFASFQKCDSLRSLITGLMAWQDKLNHIGIKTYPRRSTLSDANSRRDCKVFEDIYYALFNLHKNQFYPDSHAKGLEKHLYMMDSSTIELFSSVLLGAGTAKANGKRKGGVKVHMVIDAVHHLPQICYLSAAKENDRILMDKVNLPPGSILVFDKGYVKHSIWQRWTETDVYWVTRMNKNAYYKVEQLMDVSEAQKKKGVISDEIVLLGRGTNPSTEIIPARKIEFYDKEKDRKFTFLTNHEHLKPASVAALYKKRWTIETNFKTLKQNFQLRYFLGDSSNAIMIQIWCALITDLLVKLVMKISKRKQWSYPNLRELIRMHLATYVNLLAFLLSPEKALRNQMKIIKPQLKFKFDST